MYSQFMMHGQKNIKFAFMNCGGYVCMWLCFLSPYVKLSLLWL